VSLLHTDGNGCPVPFRIATYRDPIHVLSTADPPLHTRHRRLLQPHLSPAAVADLEPAVSRIVDTHLAPVLATRRLDIVAAFSDPVPARTICELLGLPAEDVPRVLAFTLGTGALLDGVTDLDGMGRAVGSAMDLAVFAKGRLDEALDRPPAERPGLLGVFATQIEAGELTEDEVVSMLTVFVTAGSETTASLIATAIETLARDPELQDRLRSRPENIPNALEDILRSSGPFQFHYRYAPAATTLGGTDIPPTVGCCSCGRPPTDPYSVHRSSPAPRRPGRAGPRHTSRSALASTSASARRWPGSRPASRSSSSSPGRGPSAWTLTTRRPVGPASSSAVTPPCRSWSSRRDRLQPIVHAPPAR